MTTLLEHHFNFTADDLAANREGMLSEAQCRHVEQVYAKKLKRLRRKYLLAMAIIAFAIIANIYFNDVWMWVLIGSVILSHGILYKFYDSVPLQRFRDDIRDQKVLRLEGIVWVSEDGRIFAIEDFDIIGKPDRFSAFEDGAFYFVYLLPRSEWIVSAEQGDIPPFTYHFDFVPADVIANRKHQLSERQRRRLKQVHDIQIVLEFPNWASLTLGGLCLLTLLTWFGSHLQSKFMFDLRDMLAGVMAVSPFVAILEWFTARQHKRELADLLNNGQVASHDFHKDEVISVEETEVELPHFLVLDGDSEIQVFYRPDGEIFQSDVKYRLYYWTANHSFLSLEALEPIS